MNAIDARAAQHGGAQNPRNTDAIVHIVEIQHNGGDCKQVCVNHLAHIEAVLTAPFLVDMESRHPVSGQHFCLFQHRLRCPLLLVWWIPVLAQDTFHQSA